MQIILEILGWIGTFLIVWAYYLISTKKLDFTSKTYHYLNLFGAIGVGVNVLYKQSWPAVALEVVWISITVMALIKNK